MPSPHQASSRTWYVAVTSRAVARRRLSHEVAADVAQRGLALDVLAGGHHLPDAHVRAEREQHQQQAPAQDLSWDPLLVRHRDELLGQAGQVVGVLEHVEQVDGSQATHDLRLERPQPARLVELVQPWHVKPGLAAALTEVDAAGPPSPERSGQVGRRLVHAPAQVGDEVTGVDRLPDGCVVDVPFELEVLGQVGLRVAPAGGAYDPDLPPPRPHFTLAVSTGSGRSRLTVWQ